MNNWLSDFMTLFSSDMEDAYRFKHLHIPQKLYKYQSLSERNIDSLKNNKVWFSNPKNLNDPFDCSALYYDEEFLLNKLSNKNVFGIANSNDIKASLRFIQRMTKITCFTENPFNMPMWAHYGDNHKGICVEYDLTQLPFESKLSRGLYPVKYENKRYDGTNILKMIYENDSVSSAMLFYTMLFKHQSWSYEKEWRIILMGDDGKGGLEDFPIKPTGIYFGLNTNRAQVKNVMSILDDDIKINRLRMQNDEYFNLESYEWEQKGKKRKKHKDR
ncbi:DUF2971 domain-containing protein [Peribacillus simplex]|uniref:DUF2971 domain-containing protein n=1 Tax=Peribacillus simplex TaxID=1478 RepID=A0A9W4KQX9_9BACI|nr:DUF2971 domain-containing protein [Peribacillus simplex]CAH0184875.1 hypothetical protein SRABI133_01519 [Peribacillus simplex]